MTLPSSTTAQPDGGHGCLGTVALGLLGSVVGGTLLNLLFDSALDLQASGVIGSILGAVIILTVARLVRRE